jgi:hypothetical protein
MENCKTRSFITYMPQIIKSRIMRWAGHVARIGDRRVSYRVLVGRPKGNRPLGKPRHRRKDNIKWIFKK